METKSYSQTLCSCVSVVRGNWDKRRNCFKYTLLMKPISDDTADDFIDDSEDLFAPEFRCPITDVKARSLNAEKAAKAVEGAEDSVLNDWDALVTARFLGKKHAVKHKVFSVEELTDGKYTSYKLKIEGGNADGSDWEDDVTSRQCSCLGDWESAVARLRNQVGRACKAQYESEEAG